MPAGDGTAFDDRAWGRAPNVEARIGLVLAGIGLALALWMVSPLASGVCLIATALAGLLLVTARDAVTVLTVVIVAAYGIPANYIITGLGPVGVPSIMFGLGSLVWWQASKLVAGSGVSR